MIKARARVLLVDDNAALLSAAGRALRDLGLDVTSTNSGADALTVLRSTPPVDLLILDMLMPGIDGADVLASLGASAPPVVIITGNPEDRRVPTIPPVVRVLTKPFDHRQLVEVLESVLSVPTPAAPPEGKS